MNPFPAATLASKINLLVALLSFAPLSALAAATSSTPNLVIPDGYEVQRLEPAGAEVLKPKGWFFGVSSTKDSAVYQITKEDPTKGGFETGLTINFVPGINAKTGTSASGYILYFFAQKKDAGPIISKDPVTQPGAFTRFAFVTDETRTARGATKVHRISYCLFADDEKDLLVLMVFGCPRDEWKANEATGRTLCEAIRLYDGKQGAPIPVTTPSSPAPKPSSVSP